MILAKDFIQQCSEMGFNFFTGTPCSYLKPFINTVIDSNGTIENLRYVAANNEGEAMALAAGAFLAKENPVVMFQNSGLGNAVNALTSLNYIFKIPCLGITTLRGDPLGDADEPQHELMGSITTQLLELMKIKWSFFPQTKEEIIPSLTLAINYIKETSLPYFFVMKNNSVEGYELKNTNQVYPDNLCTRTQALQIIKKYMPTQSAFVATTGKTNREFYEIEDAKENLYMVGSMGHALSFGIGLTLSLNRPNSDSQKTICVIDGDGSLMMRMGSMSMVGTLNPKNLVHILLDNGQHDSTGGQTTSSEKISFENVAHFCGYDRSFVVKSAEEFSHVMSKIKPTIQEENCFIRFFIKPGSPKTLGRPKVTPQEVALRFKNYLNNRYTFNALNFK